MSIQGRSAAVVSPVPSVDAQAPQAGPIAGAAEVILGRVRQRRQELAAHSPDALRLAAVVLAAMHDAAHGHVPAIRADRPVRYREAQLIGEKTLGLEDLVAIGEEGSQGRSVVLAGLRVLGMAWGYTLEPVDGQAERASEALAEVSESAGRAQAAVARALGDGRLDAAEADAIAPHVDDLRSDVARLDALVAQARLGRIA